MDATASQTQEAATSLARDPYEALIEHARIENVPMMAHWEVTQACNLRCRHCFIDDYAAAGELSTAEGRDLLDQLARAGCLYLTMSGGEPLLRPDFFDLLQHARRDEFAVRLMTNGTLIGPHDADRLAELGLLSMEISVHGARAETHEKLTRVPGSFDGALRALGLARERGIRAIMKTMVTRDNFDEFADMKAMAEQRADQWMYDPRIIARRDGSREALDLRLEERALARLFGHGAERVDDSPEVTLSPDLPVCAAGRSAVAIGSDGAVSPCAAYPIEAGNIREQPFLDIWQNSEALARVRALTRGSVVECEECALASVCLRCPGVALLEDGDDCLPSSISCTLARAYAQAMSTVEKGSYSP
jgi:radical SAM protein with 4Fe4S-binding SPASM domain